MYRQFQQPQQAGGLPRRRPRDIDRIGRFRSDRVDVAAPGGWAADAEVEDRRQEAHRNNPEPRFRGRNRPRNAQMNRPPIRAEPLQTMERMVGPGVGSRPMVAEYSHNLEFSTFPILAHEMYDLMIAKDQRLRRAMPFCIWQHYLCEILNATIIDRVVKQNGDERFAYEVHPFDVLDIQNLLIPSPFIDYINGITSSITQAGSRVKFNLPDAGVPQHTIDEDDNAQHPVDEIPSGSFGYCTADSHNAYECYVSPYITRKLVERTLLAYDDRALRGPWNPLPDGAFPMGTVATRNLLGYEEPEVVQADAVNSLRHLDFVNADSMRGRLSHSAELVNKVNTVLARLSDSFDFKTGITDPTVSPSIFIYTTTTTPTANNIRLSNIYGPLYSPETFGSSASSISHFFSYKRIRAVRAYGHCYATPANAAPPNWNESTNRNVEMVGTFAPVVGVDFPTLRAQIFYEDAAPGNRTDTLRVWMNKAFVKRM